MSQALEERLAHLIRMVDDLSDMVADQGRQIDTLTRQVAHLRSRAAAAEAQSTGGVILGDERPPHY